MIAPGSTFAFSVFVLPRAPPSSSYSTLRSSSMRIFFAFVICTNGDLPVEPTAVRATVRAHSPRPSALVTPTSSSPSSGRAFSNASTPPKSEPTLPSRTQLALPLYQSSPLTSMRALKGSSRRLFDAVQTYASPAEPILEAAVRLADHARVEARAGHDREPLAVDLADVEHPVAAR